MILNDICSNCRVRPIVEGRKSCRQCLEWRNKSYRNKKKKRGQKCPCCNGAGWLPEFKLVIHDGI